MGVPHDLGSRSRLTLRDAQRFGEGTLFDKIARTVCAAECLPRKELYEAWEVARRVRRRFRGGRVLDLAAGHGLLAQLLLVLDDSSPEAIAIDPKTPSSAATLGEAMERTWPRLQGRVLRRAERIDDVDVRAGDLLVSVHACGALTDRVLARAVAARARVVVLPCCHDDETCDRGALSGWIDGALAIDVVRAERLRAAGYAVHTELVPEAITPKNRLLMGTPS